MGGIARQLVAAIMQNHRFDDHLPESLHSSCQPRWYTTGVEGKVGTAAASDHGVSIPQFSRHLGRLSKRPDLP